jgi:hypothetical protein
LSAGDAEGRFHGGGLALKFFDQGGFPDARLPRDEDDLELTLQRPSEAIPQEAELALSADQPSGSFRDGRRRGLRQRPFRHRGHKPVPSPGQCLNKKRILRAVAQRAPYVGDLVLQDLRLDERIRPHGLQQLILGDQAAGAFHEVAQNGKRFGSQWNALFVTRVATAL